MELRFSTGSETDSINIKLEWKPESASYSPTASLPASQPDLFSRCTVMPWQLLHILPTKPGSLWFSSLSGGSLFNPDVNSCWAWVDGSSPYTVAVINPLTSIVYSVASTAIDTLCRIFNVKSKELKKYWFKQNESILNCWPNLQYASPFHTYWASRLHADT